MIKIIYILFCSLLFSSNILSSNQKDMQRVNDNLLILENKVFSYKIDDLKLFDTSQNKYEPRNFVAPQKFTTTTLEPLNRDMSLLESAHLLRSSIIF